MNFYECIGIITAIILIPFGAIWWCKNMIPQIKPYLLGEEVEWGCCLSGGGAEDVFDLVAKLFFGCILVPLAACLIGIIWPVAFFTALIVGCRHYNLYKKVMRDKK